MTREQEQLLNSQYDPEPSNILISPDISKRLMDNEYQSLIDSSRLVNRNQSKEHSFERKSECGLLLLKWCCKVSFLKNINVKHGVLALFVLSLVTIFYYTHYVDNGVFVR